MGILNSLKSRVLGFALRSTPDSAVMVEAAKRRGFDSNQRDGIYKQLIQDAETRQAKNLKVYKDAVAMATDPEEPDRQELSSFFNNMLLDNHLRSLIDSIILHIQRSKKKLVDNDGEETDEAEDLGKLLDRPWFNDLIRLWILSDFQGTTLLEAFEVTKQGELARIDEIPQSHFNPVKGLIYEEAGGATGRKWAYKEAPLDRFYLQLRDNRYLGKLERLAPMTLAKKLAIGAMQDYIDKFGVPPIFITTNRQDDGKIKELYNAAMQFKNNHFMLAGEGDKFEIGQVSGQGVSPFESAIKIANHEISKGVLGGSSIADEKSFVGSAEIQFSFAKDRFESYKQSFEYLFNTVFVPTSSRGTTCPEYHRPYGT